MANILSYDALLSTTLANYRAQLADNVTKNVMLLWWLREKGRIEPVDGGTKIVEPLMYGRGIAKSYSPYQELEVPAIEGISAAEYNWKYIYTSIVMSLADINKNSGSSAIINLLKAKIEQAEIAMAEDMNAMGFGDGLGNGGLDFLGLQAIVAVAPTTGILGGIDRAYFSWWRNKTASGAQSSTAFDNLLKEMRKMYISVSGKGIVPDVLVTTPTVFSGYEGLLQPLMRFTDNKYADAGFDNLTFKSKPIFYDDDCPSGCMYFLNSRYLKLRPHTNENFINTDFVTPPRQRVKLAYILLMGNLTCSNCRRQGVIHSIS